MDDCHRGSITKKHTGLDATVCTQRFLDKKSWSFVSKLKSVCGLTSFGPKLVIDLY
jgi:hypothetical protein